MDFSSVCRVCGSARLKNLPFRYRYQESWLQARECSSCGVIFLDPQPTDQQIRDMYSREYFDGDFRCGHEAGYFDNETLKNLSGDAAMCAIQAYRKSGRFLEIGCAGGAFLETARKVGFEAHGVEFSAVAAEFARTRFGLDVFTGDVLEARFPADHFDVIYMGDVIEHLPRPGETLTEVARILAHDGLLVVACPSQTSTLFSRLGFFAYALLGKTATVSMPPYHLFEYRPASLSFLLRRCGLSIVRVEAAILPPGKISLRGSVLQKAGKKIFQYINVPVTRLFGTCGDRLSVYARKSP
jgi:SAM-dependent methyltransferase